MLDKNGHEILDSTPVARPIKFNQRPMPLDEIKAALRLFSEEAARNGQETFEEAEDFDVGDDAEPYSPYEHPTDEQLSAFVEELRATTPKPAALVSGAAAPGVPGNPTGGSLHGGSTPIPDENQRPTP